MPEYKRRPLKYKNGNKKPRGFRMSEELYLALQSVANFYGCDTSDLVIDLVDSFCEKEIEQHKIPLLPIEDLRKTS